ncbi:MAG: tRNA pseudouridine(55) synthase TruB [Planctomycetota bacterium]|jgi:tRNA pseudouridine55 synthase
MLRVIDKPAGISSAKALDALKAELPRKTKVGHAGTLDPFATGVLLALVGDTTRLSDLAMGLPKEYEARVRFGWQTDTLDPEGEVVAECDPGPERELPLERFIGDIQQIPPAYSALKVNGKRAYALARKGEQPQLEPRTVTIYELEAEVDWPEATLRIRCGAGTYIRALARDLGEAIGLPASLVALRRTAIGPFRPDGDEYPPEALVAAAGMDTVDVDSADARRFVTGQAIDCGRKGRFGVLRRGCLLGLGDANGQRLRPTTVLSGARHDVEQGRV